MRAEARQPYTAAWPAARASTTRTPTAAVGPEDVLVLRALGLGDALTGIPALRGLRRLFPDRRLVLAAPEGPGGLLADWGVVDAVLPLPGLVPLPELAGGHVAVNLHGRGPISQQLLAASRAGRLIAYECPEAGHAGPPWRRDEHEVDRWCRLVRDAGGTCGREDLRLRPRPDTAAFRPEAAEFRPGAPGPHPGAAGSGPAEPQRPVLVHPGAASVSRRWPVEKWREVAGALASRGYRVLVTGSAAERGLGPAVAEGLAGVEDHTGRHDLPALSALVRGSALVLSGDTGIAHLATAWCVRSVVLFGPVPPAWWGPAIDHHLHTVLWHGDPAAGAWGDPHGETVDPRLAAIDLDEVLAAAGAHVQASTHSREETP